MSQIAGRIGLGAEAHVIFGRHGERYSDRGNHCFDAQRNKWPIKMMATRVLCRTEPRWTLYQKAAIVKKVDPSVALLCSVQ